MLKVVVVVYNRFENIKNWLECWQKCDQMGAELVVIHNYDNVGDTKKYRDLCLQHQVTYVPRQNKGFDIGAFQDVCAERLYGFENNWSMLFWITDDTIIMRKDFLSVFVDPMNRDKSIGITCAEISNERSIHIRTSGFCIRKETAVKLKFPVDPVLTKQHCYQFEHIGDSTLIKQIKLMGLKVIQPLKIENGVVWDIGHRKSLNRYQEHNKVFSNALTKNDKVTFICPVYNSFPEIISSLICQTHKNWELLLIHDGPNETGLKKTVESFNDQRITYIEREKRVGNWGHAIRKWALEEIKNNKLALNTDYVVVTNGDNYHTPTYCEYLLNGFYQNKNAVGVFCDKMVHSYVAWDVINCSFKRGFIDCAGVMIKKEAACSVGWNDVVSHSSDWTYFEDIAKKYGANNFFKIKGCLLIHN